MTIKDQDGVTYSWVKATVRKNPKCISVSYQIPHQIRFGFRQGRCRVNGSDCDEWTDEDIRGAVAAKLSILCGASEIIVER